MAAQDQQQIDGQVALLRNLVEQLRKDMEAREREQDLQQDRDHWRGASRPRNVNFQLRRNLMPEETTSRATDGNAPGAGCARRGEAGRSGVAGAEGGCGERLACIV